MSQIDVIMPTYNQKDFLDRAINCILDQEFKDFSFIIVDDGSIDGTSRILDEKYGKLDRRITVIHNETNRGLPASLNIGHSHGNSSYCTWVSTDNFSYKNQLRVLYECITKNNYDFIQSLWRGIEGSRITGVYNSSPKECNCISGNLCPSFMYHRKVWETYHYDENMMTVEDLKFFLQACYHPFKFGFVDECLLDYYYQPNSLTVKRNPKRAYQDMMDEIQRTIIAPHQKK